MSKFDQAPPRHTARGEQLEATMTATASGWWQAVVRWKNPRRPAVQLTQPSEERLRAALRQLDPTVVFRRERAAPAVSEADEAALEALRVDPAVSDLAYASACRRLGQKPQPRPDFTKTVEVVRSPYSEQEQLEINRALAQRYLARHPDLAAPPHGEYNLSIFERWFADEAGGPLALTTALLERAHAELFALDMLRDHRSGLRGARPVRPYSRAAIVEYRREKAALANPAPPPQTHQAHMQDRKRLERLAESHVAQLHPGLNPQSGEFRAAVDAMLKGWAQESNPKLQRYDR